MFLTEKNIHKIKNIKKHVFYMKIKNIKYVRNNYGISYYYDMEEAIDVESGLG